MTSHTRSKMSRRDFLKFGGTLAASSLLAACAADQTPTVVPPHIEPQNPQLMTPHAVSLSGPLAEAAFNRMAFGPRPGHLDSFNGPVSTDE